MTTSALQSTICQPSIPHRSDQASPAQDISRTRRRYERAMETAPVVLCGPVMLTALAPADNDVEERVLATIDLDEVVRAVRGGLLETTAWNTLLRTRFGGQPGTASARERKAASRAQRRLVEWSAEAA